MNLRAMSGRLGERMAGQPGPIVVAEVLGLMALVGIADIVTGAELSFSIFYLVPIVLAARTLPLRAALLAAVLASMVWLAADWAAGQEYSNTIFPFWNAAIRLGYFVLFIAVFAQLRGALEREKAISRRDPLTGLYNRRAFDELVGGELERALRYQRPFSVAYVDLDHFKAVNDGLGHHAGDVLLQDVAGAITASLRASDVVARLGGDEFGIAFPETTEQQAHAALEKSRRTLAALMNQKQVGVTFSIGVATALSGHSLVDLMNAADVMVFEAKRAGGDRILSASGASMYGAETPTEADDQALSSVVSGPIVSTVMLSDYERVINPAYLADLSSKKLEEVRAMRDECQVMENAASYVRRFVQGRLDLVASARLGRATATPAEISDVISATSRADLPTVMARPPQDMSADFLPDHLIDQLDSIIAADELVDLSRVSPDRLTEAFDELTAFEQQVSAERRTLHEVIDRIQAEVVRRYRSGEATVDSLLDSQ